MRYRVVEAESVEELEGEVERLLDRGWRLQGGVEVFTVVAATSFTKRSYCQAMTKERAEREE